MRLGPDQRGGQKDLRKRRKPWQGMAAGLRWSWCRRNEPWSWTSRRHLPRPSCQQWSSPGRASASRCRGPRPPCGASSGGR